MQDLTYRQQKIQEKRKLTSFRDFLMEICSWFPLNFYKNNGLISIYPPTGRITNVIDSKEYHTNYYNVLENVDINTNNFLDTFWWFYQQYHNPNVYHIKNNENCNYANRCFGAKNAYLSFISGNEAENILYSTQVVNVRYVINSSSVMENSENIYSSKIVYNSFNIFYSQYIYNCSDMWFCSNCVGCHFCMECDNLENASYCIKNQQYTKEEFNRLKNRYLPRQYDNLHKQTLAHRGMNIASTDVSGNGLYQCHNVKNGYSTSYFSDSRNIILWVGLPLSTNFYDVIDGGANTHYVYATCWCWTNSNYVYMCQYISNGSSNLFYCTHMNACSFCLWCIGLQNRQFCIFNKQYTKEERHEKVNEIFTQMEKDWTLWQFFPPTMNPFYFNDTAAYLIDPTFTKEEVEAVGYLRRDAPIKVDIPANAELVKVNELSNYEGFNNEGKRTIDESILKKVIIDDTGNCRRIVKMEYDFLVKYGLPLPRKHRLERMKENFRIG